MTHPRITHVISGPGGIGGAEKVLVALAKGAIARGYRYTVINPFDRSPNNSELAEELPSGIYSANSISFGNLLAARRWIAQQLEESRPEIIHAQLAHAMILVASLRRRLDVPLVASHQHGALFAVTGAPIRRQADRWATRRFDVVVAVSEQVRDFLSQDYGLDRRSIEMIPNGWEGNPLSHSPDPRPTVVTVGRFRPEKGQRVLVDAFASVVKTIPDARLVLVGDGPEMASLVRRVTDLGIANSVDLVGPQENVWPFLARAHLFALPSFSETSGIAAMEAMAAGLPVIASDVGGLREVVRNGENGVLLPPDDPEILAKALVRLLRSPVEMELMGAVARQSAERCRIESTVASYLSLYEEILE